MAKRATKSEEGTASPDPATAKSNAGTPANKSSTPAKTSKAASKDKDKEKDAAGATPTSGSKPRRQTKPRASNAGAGAGAAADKHSAMLGELQPVAKFAVVQVLALGLVTVGQMGVAAMSNNEMNGLRASKGDGVEELVWQVGWRALELAIAWYTGLDCVDVAMMSFIAHAPTFWLLGMFYGIRPITVISSLAVDVLSPAIPFYLTRPLANVHLSSGKLYNKDLISLPYQALIAALAASVYSSVLVLALRFLLPKVFVLYFSGMPTVEPAYAASFPAMLPVALCFGFASSVLVFAPYVTTGKSKEDDKIRQFDPVQASLGETVRWNFWGYTARMRVILQRTLVAMAVTGVSTYLACTASIDGVDCLGAVVYAGVWVVAAGATGASLALVGSE